MKRVLLAVLVAVLVVFSAVSAYADSEDARQAWLDAKQVTREKREIHQDAKLEFAADKTDENRQAVVDTGKEFQHAILDEAEAWLEWKRIEAQENSMIPDDLKDRVIEDVAANKEKIDDLRQEVDDVTNQIELGVVSLKMIGKYFELLTDVARDTGMTWVYIADTHADKIAGFEDKLRETAEGIDDNDEIMEKLNAAQDELESARENIDKAEDTYEQVIAGGTPFIKFREGNMYLRAAKQNMLSAHANLRQAYRLIAR
ncbi:hypothetical protein GF345_00910 [Candidatus Woesearchaeota archaeon]|nr:hypothetical protein [Candidatus Woesearchaeota archaeon]